MALSYHVRGGPKNCSDTTAAVAAIGICLRRRLGGGCRRCRRVRRFVALVERAFRRRLRRYSLPRRLFRRPRDAAAVRVRLEATPVMTDLANYSATETLRDGRTIEIRARVPRG
jgi:hypothetical protein